MWAAILAPLRSLGAWVVGLLIQYLFNWIKDAIAKHAARKEQERIDKENVAKLKRAVEAGKDEDIEKASEDLLSGRRG